MKHQYTADFETTTDLNDCRVWAYSICEIGYHENFICGNNIEDFFKWLEINYGAVVWFHNLKFDAQFLLNELFRQGYEWNDGSTQPTSRSFTTLITDNGMFYNITIYFDVQKKTSKSGKVYWKRRKVVIRDSMKVLNFSVKQIAKDFDLPISKLDLDYKAFREKGHTLTRHEIAYIRNDVEIMARAMHIMFENGMTKSTAAANALSWYKDYCCPKFNWWFPELKPEVDAVIRQSYKGGFTWLNPIYEDSAVTEGGITLDINSMYPYMLHSMSGNLMPFDDPVPFDGQYEPDPLYPLYVQQISCSFELKPGKIPSIQIKKTFGFMPTEYVTSSHGQPVVLTLTKPDYELFLQQYDVKIDEYIGGFKFRGRFGMFDDYVDHWIEEKIKNKRDGNMAKTTLAKLELNSLYGKFGTSLENDVKMPVWDGEMVHYKVVKSPNEKKGIYVPIASFTTSYARKYIIEASQMIRDWSIEHKGYDASIYHDTDSIHARLNDDDLKELEKIGFRIDDYKLGYFKKEEVWTRGKFLHSKCYIEDVIQKDGSTKLKVTVAGLPTKLSGLINFDNFKRGFTTEDIEGIKEKKLTYTYCNGGVVLTEVDFTIK